jgi:Cysteine dioxygenase type I
MQTEEPALTDHLAIAARYAAAPERWAVTPRFDPVDRWYHRLAEETGHEVWVLTWLPGQGTEIRGHGGSAGAFQVVSGSLTEDTVVDGRPPRIVARELGEGAGRRFGARHIHRVANRSGRPAVSVHVYGPALRTMTRYRVGEAGLEVRVVERAGVQW